MNGLHVRNDCQRLSASGIIARPTAMCCHTWNVQSTPPEPGFPSGGQRTRVKQRGRLRRIGDAIWSTDPIAMDRRALRSPLVWLGAVVLAGLFALPGFAKQWASKPNPDQSLLNEAGRCGLRSGRNELALGSLFRYIRQRQPYLPKVEPTPLINGQGRLGDDAQQRLRSMLLWHANFGGAGPASLGLYREDLRAVRLRCGWVVNPGEIADSVVLQLQSRGTAIEWTSSEPINALSDLIDDRKSNVAFAANNYVDLGEALAWAVALPADDPSYASFSRWIPQIAAIQQTLLANLSISTTTTTTTLAPGVVAEIPTTVATTTLVPAVVAEVPTTTVLVTTVAPTLAPLPTPSPPTQPAPTQPPTTVATTPPTTTAATTSTTVAKTTAATTPPTTTSKADTSVATPPTVAPSSQPPETATLAPPTIVVIPPTIVEIPPTIVVPVVPAPESRVPPLVPSPEAPIATVIVSVPQ
jgi:hypothetical protein